MKDLIKEKYLIIITGIMLLIAISNNLPSWYYGLLRMIVTGIAIYNITLAFKFNRKIWLLVMVYVAILFNPISVFYLSKETWVLYDLITAIILFISIFKLNDKHKHKPIFIKTKTLKISEKIVWSIFIVILVLGLYVGTYPHGPSCDDDPESSCEDMSKLNIPDWAKYVRSYGIGYLLVLGVAGFYIMATAKNQEDKEEFESNRKRLKNDILKSIGGDYILQFDEFNLKDLEPILNLITPETITLANKVVDKNFKGYIETHPQENLVRLTCLQYFLAIYILVSYDTSKVGDYSVGKNVKLRKLIAEHNGLGGDPKLAHLDFCMGSCGIEAQHLALTGKLMSQ